MLKYIWDFFQNEILGMKWLNRLISRGLEAAGLDTGSRIGGSIQFFIYDTIKIFVLLGFLMLNWNPRFQFAKVNPCSGYFLQE